MAFRAISRRRAVIPITFATATATGTLLYPKGTLYAETQDSETATKKPIYDTPSSSSSSSSTVTPPRTNAATTTTDSDSNTDSDSPTHPSPTDRLAVHIGTARKHLYHASLSVENRINAVMASALNLEHDFTTTVANLAPPKESGEKLMPGLIYVLVSTMAGSIVSRNRGLVLRGTTPLATGVVAGWYFIPVTMRNVGDLVWGWEERVPAMAEGHLKVRGFAEEAWRQSVVHSREAGRWVDGMVGEGREAVEGWVKKGR